jgi:hypothetical protein
VQDQILDPYHDAGWTLFYRNKTCCYGPGKPEPTPPPPPPHVRFEATQELYAARVNASIGTDASRCGNITTTSVVAPDDNVLVTRVAVETDCYVSLTLQTPNMYVSDFPAQICFFFFSPMFCADFLTCKNEWKRTIAGNYRLKNGLSQVRPSDHHGSHKR